MPLAVDFVSDLFLLSYWLTLHKMHILFCFRLKVFRVLLYFRLLVSFLPSMKIYMLATLILAAITVVTMASAEDHGTDEVESEYSPKHRTTSRSCLLRT